MENFITLGERFAKYLKYKGLGINKTAKIVAMSGSQISNITSGKVFGADKMFIILNTFIDLDANYLFRGKGEMIIGEASIVDAPNPIRDRLIVTQQELLDYKELEITKLKNEISELKKGKEQNLYNTRVAEDSAELETKKQI
ncbi:MAG: hypothetical protein BGO40_02765 [Chryseobacterium sp. 39-10]|nr:XRE family transcriptional regulator [Chryseobacterium sp.]OJV46501.1 MAG: hypothetical protein BGO40_02765 [Chryseobacterium sp. 39-10]